MFAVSLVSKVITTIYLLSFMFRYSCYIRDLGYATLFLIKTDYEKYRKNIGESFKTWILDVKVDNNQ